MDFEKFDNDAGTSDDEYVAFVEWLSGRAADELRQAEDSPELQKLVLCRYYKRGEGANLTAGELIDFLGVNTPSILDAAGYTDEEGDALMAISDALTDEEINQAAPLR